MTLPSALFPRLIPANHRITSPATSDYNCVAWAAEDTEHWWQPGTYWLPKDWPQDDASMAALEQLFAAMGYVDCSMDAREEPDFAKVALYGSGPLYTHAARQLPNGAWTSKLGEEVDIEHDSPEDVAGGIYGDVVAIMKRPVPVARS
jgi:hypothetical protein